MNLPLHLTALTLYPGAWDIVSLFTNAKTVGTAVGGALLGLLGVVSIACAVIFAFNKLLSEQSRRGWPMIIVLFLLGGLLIGGSLTLFTDIAQGVKPTVDRLGTGLILLGIGG
ncbi:MAG: hypothetical protein B5766_05260 [Candidatus Lumbricidophila eiseniae]|uniref:Uncharacterized protein n=1 Tax=Candidatus Lumbricidiphila eiseniae TaxID=1969409 RepID=A0A2A6FS27_9MICO|nr:MAG: hypothetical protein B5766_05260 [Candidatus Lumbricidophila eiseniae]